MLSTKLSQSTSSLEGFIFILAILGIALTIMIIIAILDAGKYAKNNYFLIKEFIQQENNYNEIILKQNEEIINALKELNRQHTS